MLSNMNYIFAKIDISLDIFNWGFLLNVLSRLNFIETRIALQRRCKATGTTVYNSYGISLEAAAHENKNMFRL